MSGEEIEKLWTAILFFIFDKIWGNINLAYCLMTIDGSDISCI